MADSREIDALIAKLRDVFPFPKEKDYDNGYDWNKKDGWHLAGIMKDPKDCLEIMIGVCEGMKADTSDSGLHLQRVSGVERKVCPVCWKPLEDGIVKNMCVNDECQLTQGKLTAND